MGLLDCVYGSPVGNSFSPSCRCDGMVERAGYNVYGPAVTISSCLAKRNFTSSHEATVRRSLAFTLILWA